MNDNMLKGKDIKTKGDCLVNCFIKKIETTINQQNYIRYLKPKEFEKW